MSLILFHLDAENETRKFRTSLSVSDTVVITARKVLAVVTIFKTLEAGAMDCVS